MYHAKGHILLTWQVSGELAFVGLLDGWRCWSNGWWLKVACAGHEDVKHGSLREEILLFHKFQIFKISWLHCILGIHGPSSLLLELQEPRYDGLTKMMILTGSSPVCSFSLCVFYHRRRRKTSVISCNDWQHFQKWLKSSVTATIDLTMYCMQLCDIFP